MPEFNTNKCILKIKWICPNPDCDEPGITQMSSAFAVKIIRKFQVVDTECMWCKKTVRLDLN